MLIVEKVCLCHVEASERSVLITAESRTGATKQLTIELRYLRFVAPTADEIDALDAVFCIDGIANVRRTDLVRLAALRDRIDGYRITYPN